MSSERNYSVSELRRISTARIDFFLQLYDKRFVPLEEGLRQHPDQSGVLTVEQQDINELVSGISEDFVATSKRMQESALSFAAYDIAQPHFQPQLRNQIIAEMDGIGAMIQDLEKSVQELRGIYATLALLM